MFFISLFLVILSSYLILCIVKKREIDENGHSGFIYFLLIAFAQIVLSFEVLSVFGKISQSNFLLINFLFFISSIILFIKDGNPYYINNKELNKIKTALKRDKALMFLNVCFIFFCIFQLIRIFCFPVVFGDSLAYYLPRCTSWIQNGSINHFITPDSREIIMPVNMDFLYTWILLFRKSETGIAIFSFIGYLGTINVVYNLLKELKFSIRRRLWAVYVFSSFALVIMEMVNPCADLFIGGLILASIYLFIKFLKYNNKPAIYFSSLAYALAIGTKTTAIIAIPSVFCILCASNYIYKKEIIGKNIFIFSFLFIINFMIFSSYNYILNYLQYLNPVSCPEQIVINKFTGGFKGYIANVIKYIYTILDMSGLPKFIDLNGLVKYWQSLTLSLFGTNINAGTSNVFPGYFEFGNKMGMMHSSLGVMGILAYFPSLIYSFKRYIFNKPSQTTFIMAILGGSILFNILLFSGVMVFTSYNMRYILTFAIISSPVIAYSYPVRKHIYCKIFLCLIMFMYFICFAHHKPVSYIISCIKEGKIIQNNTDDEENNIYEYFIQKGPKNIAIMISQLKSPVYFIEKLRFHGFHIEKILAENIDVYDLSKYDYIITNESRTISTNTVIYEERKKSNRLYESECVYTVNKEKKPYIVECIVPFEYLKEKNFVKDKNYTNDKYTILIKI